jgi:hypothetical protein
MSQSLVRSVVVALGLCAATAASPALGGVVDSPLPVLQSGRPTLLLYTVPGVIKNNNLETVFICTSFDSSPMAIGVEVFAATGGPPLNVVGMPTLDGAETVGPGETATIATGATLGFHEDEIIDSLLPASVRNGSARIVATGKKLGCTAFIADELNDPPAALTSLNVIYKTKQRGD